ncbi:aldehyde dehydrogenase family protein [Martelella sp. FLE1502]
MSIQVTSTQTQELFRDLPKKLLIDGDWRDAQAGELLETRNPATGAVIGSVARGGPGDIDLAVEAARRALNGPWAKLTPFERQEILLRLADIIEKNYDLIAAVDTVDMGAPITRTLAGRRRALQLLRYYAGQATTIHGETLRSSVAGDPFVCTLKEPIGVVGAITPWNAPFGMCVWKIAPALAAGCTVVLKPAEQTPLSALLFGQFCLEAGVPPGVVNVVTGEGDTGARLAEHPDVDKVSFTGSTSTGQKIVRASAVNIKKLSLELGGKSAHIIMRDADLEKAAIAGAAAVFNNSGQICSAGTRLFVQSEIHDAFVDMVKAETEKLKLGDPLDPGTQLGPLVDTNQMERVLGYIAKGNAEGATLRTGGERPQELAQGSFVAPTIFSDVTDDMTIAREEIFGPVLSVFRFDSVDEVVDRANSSEYGLGAGLWTQNIGTAHQIGRALRTGTVWINSYQSMDPAVPFGGYKMSGYGRESGSAHIEEYLQTKAMWIA